MLGQHERKTRAEKEKVGGRGSDAHGRPESVIVCVCVFVSEM